MVDYCVFPYVSNGLPLRMDKEIINLRKFQASGRVALLFGEDFALQKCLHLPSRNPSRDVPKEGISAIERGLKGFSTGQQMFEVTQKRAWLETVALLTT